MSYLDETGLARLWDKIKGYVSGIAPNGIVDIPHGGTGANTVAEARQNINFIASNPIASFDDDTVENWMALGTGIAYVSEGILKHPSLTVASILENNVVERNGYKFINQTIRPLSGVGKVLYRAGNESGWYSSGNWVESLNEKNGVQLVKIWENASTSSAFAEQEISNISTDNTTFIMAVFNMSTENTRKYVFFAPIGFYGEALRIGNIDTSSTIAYYQRRFALTSAGKLMFTNTYLRQSSNSTNNGYLIPVAVYAVKGVQ